jgi:putative transposase
MPSTHLSLHVHVIFSTKDRVPTIAREWRDRLHGYVGGIAKNLQIVPEAIGGVNDHVHLLLGLRATHAVADVVRDLKSNSARWVHEELLHPLFSWQEGYGAFTVSPSQCATVVEYIRNQETHHHRRTFQDEYVELLQRCGIEYDPQFLW